MCFYECLNFRGDTCQENKLKSALIGSYRSESKVSNFSTNLSTNNLFENTFIDQVNLTCLLLVRLYQDSSLDQLK